MGTRIPNILHKYSALEEMDHSSPHFKYGLPVVMSPKGYSVESGDSNFTMRKTDKHKSARWSQLTSTVGGLINCSLYMLDENGTLPLCVSSPRHITAV